MSRSYSGGVTIADSQSIIFLASAVILSSLLGVVPYRRCSLWLQPLKLFDDIVDINHYLSILLSFLFAVASSLDVRTDQLLAQSFRPKVLAKFRPREVHPFTKSATIHFEHPAAASFRPAIAHPPKRKRPPSQRRQIEEALYAASFRPSRPSKPYFNLKSLQLDAVEQPAVDHCFLSSPVHDELERAAAFSPQPLERAPSGQFYSWPWLQQHEGQLWSIPSQRAEHPLDRLINLGLDKAAADGQRGVTQTGVRAWHAFCADVMHVSPSRPMDPLSPLHAKLEEEWLFMRFACALLEERHVSLGTVRNYCSQVQGWHAREHGIKLAGGLKLERLPQMLKGLRRVFGDPEVQLRRGVAPQALRKAMDLLLIPSYPPHANIRAALAVAFQGLLRSAEYCLRINVKFDPRKHLVRSDIVELTSERMVIMMTPCKNMKQLSGKNSPLVIGGGGKYIDAVAEVTNMLRVDPTPPNAACFTPLFRVPSTNSPLCYDTVLSTIRNLMLEVGENPDQFGTHSMRIGGATALFAMGADETVIKTMGRWCSDIHRLYVRACFERCCEWTKMAGSVVVTDVAQIFDFDDHGDGEGESETSSSTF